MPNNEKKPYSITVEIPPARPDTAEERAERARDRERAEYHSAARPEFDTVNVDRTSWALSDTLTYELRDGRGNVATTSINTETRESGVTLRCRDGRRLSENVASDAVAAVYREGTKDAGWFSDDYQSRGVNPLESACRVDHNRRAHGGREPE